MQSHFRTSSAIEREIHLKTLVQLLNEADLNAYLTGPEGQFLTTENFNEAVCVLIDEYSGANSQAQKIAAYLLNHGAQINVEIYGTLLLIEAINKNDRDWVEFFINHGAEVNIEFNGSGPLLETIKSGNLAMLSFLLAKGGDVCLGMEYNESNSSVLIDAARKYKHNDIFKYLFESIVAKLKELAPEPIATSIDTNILLPPDLCDQTLEDGYQSDGTDNTVCLECPSVTEFVLSQCSLCAKGNPDLLRFILQYIEKQKLVEEKIMDINSRDKEGRSILEYTNKWEVIAINSQKDCGINNENQRITNPSTIEAVMDHSNNEDVDTRETLTRTFSL